MPAAQVGKTQKERGRPAEGGATSLAPPPRHGPPDGWQPADHPCLFLEIQIHLTQGTHCHPLREEMAESQVTKREHIASFFLGWVVC